MAVVPGTITETGQAITVILPTKRHPELPAIEDIADDDIWTVWDKSENKTKGATTDQLRTKINGAAIESPPVLSGADMEIVIPSELDGQTRIDLPELAGKNYSLERIGPSTSSRFLTSWFNNLSTGGWELTREGDVFYEGETWIAHIYELEGGSSTVPGNTGGGGGFVKGILTLTTDFLIGDADMGKLISSSGSSSKLTHTLDDVTNVTENATVDIITMVNNEFQTTIKTTSGQFIYINGDGKLEVYLGIGESIKLVRGDDGWYAMGPVLGYLRVGQPFSGYKQVLNSIIAEGQLLNRADYPRLWEFAQSTGTSLLSDAEWLSSGSDARRGCFSTGNGTTTFRVPDLRGTSPRWLDRGRGFDTNPREYTMAGSYQPDAVKSHDHDLPSDILYKGTTEGGIQGSEDWVQKSGKTASFGESENTVKTTGLLGLIGT